MHSLEKYLPLPLMKGESFKADNWKFREKEFSENEIQVDIEDGLPSSMQDELGDNQEDYYFLAREDCCNLLSTI